jgi:hypothetical protein
MSAKIINAISALIEENGNEDFIALWNDEKKEEILAMLKKLEKPEKKAAKKDKDENAPKKNVSAWILFFKAERPKIKKEFPSMKPQEVMAELSKRWKIAKDDEEVMKEFAEKAKQDKERYEEEKKDYVPPPADENDDTPKKGKKGGKKAKKEKKVKAEGEPKRAKSAWLFFCDAERKKLAKEENAPKGKDILGELAKRWKDLSDKKKKKYNKLAEEAKAQYTEDMEKFKAAKAAAEEEEAEYEEDEAGDEAGVETEVEED